jgi:K(+)-stimulated pyrophosphate-energized sodium pump
MIVMSFVAVKLYLPGKWGIAGSVVVGLIVGLIIGKSTEYFTSSAYPPTRALSKQSEGGPATVIISGLALGMISTAVPLLAVAGGVIAAFLLSGGTANVSHGLYGIAIASVGMLSTLGITLATDAYGPVADNAGGNATMSGLPEEVRKRTDALDALGNTTAAIGKGFAIGSAALTAMALVAAYIEEVKGALLRVGQVFLKVDGVAVEVAKANLQTF